VAASSHACLARGSFETITAQQGGNAFR